MTTTALIADHDHRLLPDESLWGQGYGGRPYTPAELDAIAHNIAPLPGPVRAARLRTGPAGLPRTAAGTPLVPAGHDLLGHPNRAGLPPTWLDREIVTTPTGEPRVPAELQRYFRDRGWGVDQHGRPLHPHAGQLLADPRIGLPTGLGLFYRWGEAVIADAVVTTADDRILLVPRDTPHDGRIPALPGGHTIPADQQRSTAQWAAGDRPVTVDGILAAARRKAADETGLRLPDTARMRIVRGIRPVSSVHTLHAWSVVYTVHIALPARVDTAVDPLSGAYWQPRAGLDAVLPSMWPDHRAALTAALTHR